MFRSITRPHAHVPPHGGIGSIMSKITLDTWAAEIDAFISMTLEEFEAARLADLGSDELAQGDAE